MGAEEAPLPRDQQPPDRRLVRAGAEEWRPRRQAGGRRRWRLPDVLCIRSRAVAGRDVGSGIGRGALPVRLRRHQGRPVLRMLPVAILAGGRATRLRPLTDRVPKSLLNVAGRPFIFHQLEMLRVQRIERVVLCVAHLGEQIQAAVGDAAPPGLTVSYCFDGNRLLGTAGALKQALPLLGEEFFVLNGDSYLRCSLPEVQAAYRTAGRPALMTVLRNDNRWDRSNVLFRDGRLLAYDKRAPRSDMSHIDFGLSVLSGAVFTRYARESIIDLSDVFRDLAQRGELAALEVSQRFYEIGSPQGLTETEKFLTRGLDDGA